MENVQKLRVYRKKYKRFHRARVKGKAGQGLEVISFGDEHRVLNTRLVQECESPRPSCELVVVLTWSKDGQKHYKKCKRILSPKAKSIISRRLEAGDYEDHKDKREPPFMAPSVDPEDYSKVRSNTTLLSNNV